MADALNITLHALAAEAVSGEGLSIDIGSTRSAVKLALRVSTLVSGSLTATLQTSPDGNTWRTVGAFAAITAAPAVVEQCFDRCERYVRVKWVYGGSPGGGTFSLDGKAHQLFATRVDLDTAMPSATLAAASDSRIAHGLIKGSTDTEDALGTVHDLPITAWSESVTTRAAAISAYHIAMGPGFAGAGIDELLVKNHDDAQSWLKRVAKGDLDLVGVTPAADSAVLSSSGNPALPDDFRDRMSDNWGDF